MNPKVVDVDELKRDIRNYMSTGFKADDKLCKILLQMIDVHTHGTDIWKSLHETNYAGVKK